MVKKKIGVIGSTGSIGKQAIDVISANDSLFEVVFLTAHLNSSLLYEQAELVKPKFSLLTSTDEGLGQLNKILDNEQIDLILFAASGIMSVGLVYNIVKHGIDIALANKESIVNAGAIILEEAERTGSKVIPVDSEHSAIFQCLRGEDRDKVSKIILTASGGPFRNRPVDAMKYVSMQEALNHPSWSMGRKITVDSATMMNKGLELIEARYLFNVTADKLDAIIHPECIVHSMVEFNDGAILAQLGEPTMKTPISFALGFPNRIVSTAKSLKLYEVGQLTFEKVDYERFRCLKLARKVLEMDSNAMMIALNASNEVAVDAFLRDELEFEEIPNVIESALGDVSFNNSLDIFEVIENSNKVEKSTLKLIKDRR